VRLPRDKESGHFRHTLPAVYGEMLLQICRDYSSLPAVCSLTMCQIRFFFEGVRPELIAATGREKG